MLVSRTVVKCEVIKGFMKDRGVVAGLLRLHFHDCFVRGCDGSVLIDSTPSNMAERDSPANNPSLRGFEIIDNAKARLEATCKGVISCADMVAFAARDSIQMSGADVNKLTQMFANKGPTQEEMVILSGAHTIGRSHCTSFISRLYSYNLTTTQDPALDANYATQLKQHCPQDTGATLVVPMDPISPYVLDTGYYMDVRSHRGLFTSDQTLLTNLATANLVNQYAMYSYLWRNKFAAAMVKMGKIGVLTGNDGEVRANCRVIN
ncbi:Peroxidase 5-like protein [Drosera capensis]